uniref:WD repeat-containing protein 79 n=1 Tax=Mesocestoides corti TaxID=53468 RepID=A0A5K3EFA9_MESCO
MSEKQSDDQSTFAVDDLSSSLRAPLPPASSNMSPEVPILQENFIEDLSAAAENSFNVDAKNDALEHTGTSSSSNLPSGDSVSPQASTEQLHHKCNIASEPSETVHEDLPINWPCPAPNVYVTIEKEFCRFSSKIALRNNYLRGCVWSPDGTCLLTNSCDNIFRIFEFSPAFSPEGDKFDFDSEPLSDELPAVLWMREQELVYDYCWFPSMSSDDPVTCCFASTSRRTPIHLWDAFNGTLRATYRPFNHVGELTSAQSIAFSGDGTRLYCGFNRYIQVFNVEKPGCHSERRPRLGKRADQGGIISALASLHGGDLSQGIYAAGSFSGSVGVYSESMGGQRVGPLLQGPRLGISQVKFVCPANGATPWLLIAGGRADGQIFVWDARWMRDREPLAVIPRRVENYQRFQFDVDFSGRYLFTGNQTGAVSCFDLTSPTIATVDSEGRRLPGLLPAAVWLAHEDSCHGVSIHPFMPILATASGQKRLPPSLPRQHRPGPAKRRLCEQCGKEASAAAAEEEAAASGSNSSDSEDETTCRLSETESVAVTNLYEGKLPLAGRLHRLPMRNEVKLWTFPYCK